MNDADAARVGGPDRASEVLCSEVEKYVERRWREMGMDQLEKYDFCNYMEDYFSACLGEIRDAIRKDKRKGQTQ